MSLYEVLGVDPSAGFEAIKRAYYRVGGFWVFFGGGGGCGLTMDGWMITSDHKKNSTHAIRLHY